MNKDPYSILGVSRGATEDDIKRAYRRLAKEFHPDRNRGDKQAETRFKEVQAAYEVIGDPARRRQYDQFGAGGPTPEYRQWQHPGGGGASGGAVDIDFGDLSSIFEQFFQRGSARGGRSQTQSSRHERAAETNGSTDIEIDAEITFDEALHGAQRKVTLAGGGTREVVSFRIPPGVRDGQRIRVRGRGHATRRGRGNLLVRCHVQPHPWFRLEGRNVVFDLPLSVSEAALGTKVEVPTPSGTRKIAIPAGTSSGTRLRLRGLGAAETANAEAGDFYAVVRIVVPKNPSDSVRKLFEKLAETDEEDVRADAPWTASS